MSEINADDWDTHWAHIGTSAEINPAQRYRRKEIFAALAATGQPEKLLDVGSGQGDFLRAAASRWPEADLLGVEHSSTGAEISAAKVPEARFVRRDLLADDVPPPAFAKWATHAVCSEVLEHVDNPTELLRQAQRFMSQGCWLVVTVPGGPRSAFDRHIGHRRHYTRADVERSLHEAGFSDICVHRSGFPIFNLYKLIVIARGKRLVADVRSSTEGVAASLPARLAMRVFDLLFRLARPDSRWGWQLIAVCRLP